VNIRSPASSQTSYERATASYDAAHAAALLEAIATAILQASRVSDAECVAIRTSEMTDALVQALTLVLALRPEARVPSQLRHLVDDIARRLRSGALACRSDPEFNGLVRTWFDGGDRGGNA
jgi:hypothetical protein